MRHKGSVGLIMTQLATDELVSPRDEGYRDMIAVSLAGRAGNPDAVGQLFVPVRVCQLKQASSSYSITSSARARTVVGIVRFKALAVLTFTVNSNLVGKLTGKLTGFSPLRILLT